MNKSFFSHCKQFIIYEVIALIVLIIGRCVFLYRFGLSIDELPPLFFWNSWRFDAQVLAYIGIPMLVAIIVFAFIRKDKPSNMLPVVMRYYFSIVITIMAFIVIAEFYFYNNFNERYNTVFFDFFNENPMSLLQTFWQDYPLGWILLGLIAFFLAIFLCSKRWISPLSEQNEGTRSLSWTIAASVILLEVTFVMIRGSVGTFPLQVEDFMVSDNDKVNESVPNALYMLKKAWSEKSKSFKLKPTQELLSENGYADLASLISDAGYKVAGSTSEEAMLHDALFRKTVKSASEQTQGARQIPDGEHAEPRPDILFILNESWSLYLNEMDKGEKLDLLTSLRQHWEQDFVFKNFQSVRNGTIYTLETVVLATPLSPYFKSAYRTVSLPTSIALPFKQNGYRTEFITGLAETWENIGGGLKLQYFDDVYGQQHLLNTIQGSSTSITGVYDQYLYDYLFDELKKKTAEPRFIMALTSTNHSPYTFPEDMKLPELTASWYDSKALVDNSDLKEKNGKGLQYANKSLGDFLTKIKQNKRMAENTIIVVTGDHNARSILNYEEGYVPQKYRYSVPLYIYMPDRYKDFDTEVICRYGCHFDILPTLAYYCFSDSTEYLNIGHDLLHGSNEESYLSYNENQLLSDNPSENDALTKMMKARELLLKIFIMKKIHG